MKENRLKLSPGAVRMPNNEVKSSPGSVRAPKLAKQIVQCASGGAPEFFLQLQVAFRHPQGRQVSKTNPENQSFLWCVFVIF